LAIVPHEFQREETVKKKVKKVPRQARTENKPIRIYTDGSGCRPDGMGSGFAFVRENGIEPKVIRVFKEDRLTNNQAEYKAILSALDFVPLGSTVEILTDSENTCFQLKGERRVKDPKLADLHAAIHSMVKKNELHVAFTWIPRRENKAGKLI
jgi:ribonuclease HI